MLCAIQQTLPETMEVTVVQSTVPAAWYCGRVLQVGGSTVFDMVASVKRSVETMECPSVETSLVHSPPLEREYSEGDVIGHHRAVPPFETALSHSPCSLETVRSWVLWGGPVHPPPPPPAHLPPSTHHIHHKTAGCRVLH